MAQPRETESSLVGCEILIEIFQDTQKVEMYGQAPDMRAPEDAPPPSNSGRITTKKKASGSKTKNP